MDLGFIISFGILLTYINFLIHDAEIFSFMRIPFEMWLKMRGAAGNKAAFWAFKLYSCHLCLNFWLSLLICFLFSFPYYLPLTAPVIAFIIRNQWLIKK